ncbi:MAG: DeoR/GlpR transcriptional regulator [Spirochaetaceae bacterium]|nr:DeoR/GlpR transcriptional regulator [Spirochaetaceae bacterium]
MAINIIPAARQSTIVDLIKKDGLVTVEALSRILNVSVITVRRDLSVLEEKGLLERTHGGAVFTKPIERESYYPEKDRRNKAQKEAIGKAAAALVEDGDTVFINSGSTTYQVIRFLEERKNVTVITNNAAAVADFIGKPGIELILTGGIYRHQSNCLIGDFAVNTVNMVVASKIIMGVDGLCFKEGLTSPVYQEAGITKTMIERTQGQVICVADSSKIGKVTNFVTAPLSILDILVTDWLFDEELRQGFKELSTKIIKLEEDN